ncbi:unnamed protein product, partial [Schistosoma rodhaini]
MFSLCVYISTSEIYVFMWIVSVGCCDDHGEMEGVFVELWCLVYRYVFLCVMPRKTQSGMSQMLTRNNIIIDDDINYCRVLV